MTPVESELQLGAKVKAADRMIDYGISKGIRPTVAGKSTFGQTEKYAEKAREAVKTILANKENLNLTDEFGELTGKTPRNLREFSQAIEKTKQSVFAQYDAMAKQAGEAGAEVKLAPVAKELKPLLENKALIDNSPDTVNYAAKMMEIYGKRGAYTTEEAQDAISQLNQKLEAFYKNPNPNDIHKAKVDALIANNLRKSLDNVIEKNHYVAETTLSDFKKIRKNPVKLKEFIAEKIPSDFEGAVGIRGLSPQENDPVNLKNSRVWVNNYRLDKTLPGTSTVGISKNWSKMSESEKIKAVKYAAERVGFYPNEGGIAIVKGANAGKGSDVGELIISSAKIAHKWENPINNKIKKMLHPDLEGKYQELKNKYGALKSIEKEVNQRAIVDARKNVKGLIDFSDIFSGSEVVRGVLTANPATVATGAAAKGVAAWYRYLSSPNRHIKNMFEGLEKVGGFASKVGKSAGMSAANLGGRAVGSDLQPGKIDLDPAMKAQAAETPGGVMSAAKRGIEFYTANNWDDAIREWRHALKQEPGRAKEIIGWINRALAEKRGAKEIQDRQKNQARDTEADIRKYAGVRYANR
jgi:hypothetical protein